MRLSTIFTMTLVLGSAWAWDASATRVRAMTLGDLVQSSGLVVRGTVVSQRAIWDASRQRIYTDSRVVVEGELVGRAGAGPVVVRQLGGQIGSVAQVVAGVGRLRVGETVLLFLTHSSDGPHRYVVGMAQGRFRVARRGGIDVVERDLGGLTLVRRPGAGVAAPPTTYEGLASRVRALARGR